ncbi:zinc-binding protein A33-like [Clupea harengus]|uniref:Zinc-binding protein A33-like n=1 Tax=Clupea harengus TaxID=7950 RepID=A0A6P3WFF6_CLUHA|nr:zinc-binding protein A33-like [Clupea harengus]
MERWPWVCVTDQKLLCKEQDKHQGHTFKPVKDAAEKNKGKLRKALGDLVKENPAFDVLIQDQFAEIAKSEERSDVLQAQVSSQFEVLHQFLRKREEEIQRELEEKRKRSVSAMQRNLFDIQGKAADGQDKEVILWSALEIPRPDLFLQWWHDKGIPVTGRLNWFESEVKNLVVTPCSVSMGPYESHLLFFVWREMLQTIKPGLERLSIKDPGDFNLMVSPEGHSIRQADRIAIKNRKPSASTIQTFKTGRHWRTGESELSGTQDLPRRIGLYLDCEKQQVSFYNADTM